MQHLPLVDFRIRPPRRDGHDDARITPDEEVTPYDALYPLDDTENATFVDLVAEMEEHAVRGVIQAEYESGDPDRVNRRTAELVARRPDLFLGGIATTDPSLGDGAVELLQAAHSQLGLVGCILQPGFLQIAADDPRCLPIYEYCQRTGQPVTVHTGINFSKTGSIGYGQPLVIDRIACMFPDLVIVCNHGGWPWVSELIAVMWKHENVYADFGAVAPKYLVHPGSGWHPIAHWMNTQLRTKVLFATDWPMIHYERARQELPLLQLGDEALHNYCHANAERLAKSFWP